MIYDKEGAYNFIKKSDLLGTERLKESVCRKRKERKV